MIILLVRSAGDYIKPQRTNPAKKELLLDAWVSFRDLVNKRIKKITHSVAIGPIDFPYSHAVAF